MTSDRILNYKQVLVIKIFSLAKIQKHKLKQILNYKHVLAIKDFWPAKI